MRILLVRHAIAADPDRYSDDSQRPLTPRGIKRFHAGGKGLASSIPDLKLIVSSPLRRAMQTADILSDYYPGAERHISRHLTPGAKINNLLGWLKKLQIKGNLALVGHEPDLSRLTAHLCNASSDPFLHFKKGAACLLHMRGGELQQVDLEWFLTPRQLRELGESR